MASENLFFVRAQPIALGGVSASVIRVRRFAPGVRGLEIEKGGDRIGSRPAMKRDGNPSLIFPTVLLTVVLMGTAYFIIGTSLSAVRKAAIADLMESRSGMKAIATPHHR